MLFGRDFKFGRCASSVISHVSQRGENYVVWGGRSGGCQTPLLLSITSSTLHRTIKPIFGGLFLRRFGTDIEVVFGATDYP